MTPTPSLLDVSELEPAAERVRQLLEQLDRILLGRSELHRMVLVGVLSRGHILLEGLPGVGKTALVKALGELMSLQFNRVQFTPDLMPGDILGNHILQDTDSGRREMTFQPGPIFTNILLADEINRASPKTQSAMLEAMQERCVTMLGVTRPLPDPFFVLASQNPIELEGTYPLPEAQLDRFLFKLHVGDVQAEVLEQIISSRRRGEAPKTDFQLTGEQLAELFAVMERIFLPKPVSRYIARLVAATHPGGGEATEAVNQYVSYGASPRAAIAMAEASRACALIAGRPTVGFEDVRAVAAAVLNHRMILNYKSRFDRVSTRDVIDGLLESLDETGLDLPSDMQVTATGEAS
ncbi:AAA domain-containing protein [Planctomycetales bacterium ZRK34]|nr:AAA domain-containing protein [Planctomycetales bacterium ZRK34]